MAKQAMIVQAAAMAPMERLLRDEPCCDWLMSVFPVVGVLCLSGTVTVGCWLVDGTPLTVELRICCDVSLVTGLLVGLVDTGSLVPSDTFCGSRFEVTVNIDDCKLGDADDIAVEIVVDSIKMTDLVVTDAEDDDEPVVDDRGNGVLVVKTVGCILAVD